MILYEFTTSAPFTERYEVYMAMKIEVLVCMMNMGATRSSKTSLSYRITTRCHNQDDRDSNLIFHSKFICGLIHAICHNSGIYPCYTVGTNQHFTLKRKTVIFLPSSDQQRDN